MNIKVTINVTKISNSDRISLPTQIELIENKIFTSEYVYVTALTHLNYVDRELLRCYSGYMALEKIGKTKLYFILKMPLKDNNIPSYLLYYITRIFRKRMKVKHTNMKDITKDMLMTEQIKLFNYYFHNVICFDDIMINLHLSKVIDNTDVVTVSYKVPYYIVITDFGKDILDKLSFTDKDTIAIIPDDWIKSSIVSCIWKSDMYENMFDKKNVRILIFVNNIEIQSFETKYNVKDATIWLFSKNLKYVCQQDIYFQHADYSLKRLTTCLSMYKLNIFKPCIKIIKHKTQCSTSLIAPFKRKYDQIQINDNLSVDCPICLENKQADFISNKCNHRLCLSCWEKAYSLNNVQRIICPMCRADMDQITYHTSIDIKFNDKIETINRLLLKHDSCTFITDNENIKDILVKTIKYNNYNFYPHNLEFTDCYIFLHPSIDSRRVHNITHDIELMSSLTNDNNFYFYFLIEQNNFEDKIFDEKRIRQKNVFVF